MAFESDRAASAAMAGAALLVIENDRRARVGRLGEWLVGAGARLDVRSGPDADRVPAGIDGFGGLVVLGGAPNAYDDTTSPWLSDVRRLLAEAVRAGIPTLGLGLGAQLLAVASGGQVARAAEAEYGARLIAKRQAAAQDVLFKGLPITPDVLQWHGDEVVRLPPGALLLASSPLCEVQAFRIGPRAWGLQFHLGTTSEVVRSWAERDREQLADYDVKSLLSRAEAVDGDLAQVWQPFAAAFVGVVADPATAPAPRGLPMAAAAPTSTAGPITDPAAIRAALAAEMNAARGPHGH